MDALKRVAVVFIGGTISMVVDPVAGGAVPALDGAGILTRDELALLLAGPAAPIPDPHPVPAQGGSAR